jgi:PAS domain S-box-containing protein
MSKINDDLINEIKNLKEKLKLRSSKGESFKHFQNEEKEALTDELALAKKELVLQSEEKKDLIDELFVVKKEKSARVDALALAKKELVLQSEKKEDLIDELIIAKKEKSVRVDALALAKKELVLQNEKKEDLIDELIIAKKEKSARVDALALAKKELVLQSEEKEDLIDELITAKKEKSARVDALALTKKELVLQSEKKEDLIDELFVVKKEKSARVDALALAKKELVLQSEEKKDLIDELFVVKKEKSARVDALALAKEELVLQSEEKKDLIDDLVIVKKEKSLRVGALALAKKELIFQREKKYDLIDELAVFKKEKAKRADELALLIDTANAPIFGIDSKGLVNEWNHTSEKITGFTKDEVLGKDLVKTYITEDYRTSVKQVLDDALKGKETANYEFPLFAKDGDRVMVLLNSSTRRSVSGKINGVLGVGQDITELVGYRNDLELKVNQRTLKLNEALKKEIELNELKSRFVTVASHEFRTPLSAINFAAGSMKKYWARMESIMIEKKLTKIEDQVLHMTELLDDVLLVGQAEAGEMKNHPLALNLEKFISEIIEEVYESSKKLHEIKLIDSEQLKKNDIYIDEKLGRNIFINLLSNAIKFSPDADKVIVELSSEKDYTIISVTDFGLGIPESEIEKIFMPFARGENVDSIQGTGLGLSIVKEALVVMGGKIIVNSTLGKGTTFMAKIPKKQI